MKKLLRLLGLALILASPVVLLTCKDSPDKPTITTLAPATGKEGDVVVISGSFLGSANKILFGTVEAQIVDPQGGQVSTQVPPGLTLGKVLVSVVNKGGASNKLEFTVIPPVPEIQIIDPIKGSAGMTVTITGKYFSTVKSVAFGSGVVTSFDVKNETQLGFKIPDGLALGALSVTVTTDGGTSDPVSFTVLGKPTVTDFSPVAGAAGVHVIISGTNFAETTKVFFADAQAQFTINNETQIDAVVPAGAATGKIKVSTAGGDVVSTADFVIKGSPTISVFSPASGGIGALVTINGTNLNLAGVKVKFGGIESTNVQIGSDVELKATVPPTGVSGKITVITAAGTATSATDFTVVGGPTITDFSPANGIAGTSVVINGTNFINVSSVKFNGVEAGTGNFTVNSSIKITAKVPVGATSGNVSVTTPGGVANSSSAFVIIGTPAVSSFTPTSGAIASSVVITGTGFSSVSGVKLNGLAANFTVNSATQITLTVPTAATTGKITVTNTAGTGTSANVFTVIQVPFISSINPTSGLKGSTLTITGTSLANAKVRFNTTDVTVLTANTDTQITVTIPTSLSTGAVNVSVITTGGTSNLKTFTVLPPVAVPVITSLKPSTSYKGFPIMILGSNMKNATSVMIGSVAATIVTKYDASMIVTIPNTVGNGTYNVTVVNAGGPSTALSLTIVTAPAGVGAPPAANFVSAPPANYVNVVSNNWSLFFLSEGGACQLTDIRDDTFCGTYTFTTDASGNITGNLVQFTRGTGADAESFVGQYSAAVYDPCVQKLVFISTKDGHLEYATVDLSANIQFTDTYKNGGTCE